MTLWCLALLAAVILCSPAHADTTDVAAPPATDTTRAAVTIDTTRYAPPSEKTAAGAVTNPQDLEQHLTQQPTVALFKSMLVPGWGQIGNHRYTKAALFIAVEGTCFYYALHYGGQVGDAQRDYDQAVTLSQRNYYHDILDKARKNRNKCLWYAGIATFISMFDAYVDAHLSGSPLDKRNDKVNVDLGPDPSGGVRAAINYRF